MSGHFLGIGSLKVSCDSPFPNSIHLLIRGMIKGLSLNEPNLGNFHIEMHHYIIVIYHKLNF